MRTASGYAVFAALSSLISCARADSNFYLEDEWIGDGFFQGWNWETINDPTHGRVNFVSQAEARDKNLTYGAVIDPRRFSPIQLPLDPFFFQLEKGSSSCVQTIGPSFPHQRAGVTASASRLRRRSTKQYLCSILSTCRWAVALGLPFGR